MKMYLYGRKMKTPLLRFNFSLTSAIDSYSKKGLSKYGPFDQTLIKFKSIRCIVLYIEDKETEKEIFKECLVEGEQYFKGFESLFKVPIDFIDFIPAKNNLKDFNYQLEKIAAINPDFVYIILPSNSPFYIRCKSVLLGNGIPNQVLISDKLAKPYGRQYYFENVSLATYAKVGGTPWVSIMETEKKPLIIGVSRAQDIHKKYFVGFVTVFNLDGDFIFMNSKAPVIKWEQYVEGLTTLVEESIIEFLKEVYEPEIIIFHFHKNPGKREIEAIEKALQNTGLDIPYCLIHLNEYSNFHIFDSSHLTYIPPSGTLINLSRRESLLLLDGRFGDKRSRIGVPRVLDIRMDKRSTANIELFPKLVNQINNFASMNWRGFNSAKIPVTINYSKLIAKMIAQIGAADWNNIIAQGKLRDKAWFL